jgi:hypothetical protein
MCGSVIGFALGYTLSDFSGWRKLYYRPLARVWELTARPSTPDAMVYVGLVLWGLGGAVVGGLVVFVALRFVAADVPRRWLDLAGAWALTAVALTGAYFTWNLWPF